MKINNLFTFFVVVGLLLPALAIAGDFEVENINSLEIVAGSSKNILITVNNNGREAWFSGSLLSRQNWGAISPTALKINESGEFGASFSPPIHTEPGTYSFTFSAQSKSDTSEKTFLARVSQPIYSGRVSSLSASCHECVNDIAFSWTIENTGKTKLEDLTSTLIVGGHSTVYVIADMEPGESKVFEKKLDLEGLSTTYHDYNVEFSSGEDLLDTDTGKFFKEPVENIIVTKDVRPGFFGDVVLVTISNAGNVKTRAKMEGNSPTGFFGLYNGPEPDLYGDKYTWFATLEPGETRTVEYTELYWPLPLSILMLLVGGFYHIVRSNSVEVGKRILHRGYTDDIGVSIHIKNKGDPITGTLVKDLVPSGFSVSKSFETLKPVLRKSADGTEILWRLGKIGNNEERVLHYRINAGDGVTKDTVLPTVHVKGRKGGKSVVLKSNVSVISSGEEKTNKLKVKFN